MKVPTWTVGDRMRKARLAAGLSRMEMAEVMGVAPNTVSTWETGSVRPAHMSATLRLWAETTGVPEEWLVRGEVPDPVATGAAIDTKRGPFSACASPPN
jgi:transcriptional regulator with XRE-family HTH domain